MHSRLYLSSSPTSYIYILFTIPYTFAFCYTSCLILFSCFSPLQWSGFWITSVLFAFLASYPHRYPFLSSSSRNVHLARSSLPSCLSYLHKVQFIILVIIHLPRANHQLRVGMRVVFGRCRRIPYCQRN
ncbi:hypothetical protein K474DRAFT_145555 [Panus rudis PR-1116 ss-1]|nr:hypothetical protein K474DRAFT_145555 [Panus rudis PR-1116 ss-1]